MEQGMEREIKSGLDVQEGVEDLTNQEIMSLANPNPVPTMGNVVDDVQRVISIRRKLSEKVEKEVSAAVDEIPFENYNYSKFSGPHRENVFGYVPMPVGTVGPLLLDGKAYTIPMVTTETGLISMTNRGCRALVVNGLSSSIVADKMSSTPLARFPTASDACDLTVWLEQVDNYEMIKNIFDGSSPSAQLEKITCRHAGRYLFFRLDAKTGEDVMGVTKTISKGTHVVMKKLKEKFPEMEILAINGGVCTGKKHSAMNWIHGRGKSVVAEAVVPAQTLQNVLRTSAGKLIELNIGKNLIGSAMIGSVGGFNAHAANVVAAIFLATGQVPAQIVSSSNCMTLMAPWGVDGEDLHISCTMPCMEVDTIGGGTVLTAQRACLRMLGVEDGGRNAGDLARIICATVLAGELSLMAALTTGELVQAQMTENWTT